jgi:hypothetical protein
MYKSNQGKTMMSFQDYLLSEAEKERGTYVGVKYSAQTKAWIMEYMKTNKIPNPLISDDLHSTVLYSTTQVDFPALGVLSEPMSIDASNIHLELFGEEDADKRALVMTFESEWLTERHELAMSLGGTHGFPDYLPHITLSYDAKFFDYAKLEKPQGVIQVASEYIDDLVKDWSDSK